MKDLHLACTFFACMLFLFLPGVLMAQGPVWTSNSPGNAEVITCDTPTVRIQFESAHGLAPSPIRLRVNETVYRDGDPGISIVENELLFNRGGRWLSGDSICVDSLSDTLGQPLTNPHCFRFFIDHRPPVWFDQSPADGEIVSDPTPTICFSVADAFPGVDRTSLRLYINGISYAIGDPGVGFDIMHERLCWYPVLAGYPLPLGPVVEVRLVLRDMAVPLCDQVNVLDDTIHFSIQSAGPTAEIVRPLPGTFSACPAESVVISITGENGVDPASIRLEVLRGTIPRDTVEVGPTMTFTDSLLVYHPTPALTHGEWLRVTLLAVSDSLGNPLDSALTWIVRVDTAPPDIGELVPRHTSEIPNLDPIIEWTLRDGPAGVDSESVRISVDGRPSSIVLHRPASDLWFFYPDSAGLTFAIGDTVDVCVHAADLSSSEYCGPNTLDTCWWFTIGCSSCGPHAMIWNPLPGTFTACPPESGAIVILLEDLGLGVDPATIRLDVNRIVYGIGPELSYGYYRSLVYHPSVPFADGETIRVRLLGASNWDGYPLRDTLDWQFTVDVSPPSIGSIFPAPGAIATTPSPIISCTVWDLFSGIDTSRFEITISTNAGESERFGISSPAVTWDGLHIALDMALIPWSPHDGDSLRVCIRAADFTPSENCGPNMLDTCWSFTFDLSGVAEYRPREHALGQPYPNPSRDGFSVAVRLLPGDLLDLYDLLGTPIADLSNRSAVNGSVQFRDNRLAPGVYWIVLQREGTREVRRWIRQ